MSPQNQDANIITLNTCTIVLDRGVVRRDGVETALRNQEARFLDYLIKRPNQVVPRGDLLEAVWGYSRKARTRVDVRHVLDSPTS